MGEVIFALLFSVGLIYVSGAIAMAIIGLGEDLYFKLKNLK